MIAFFNNTFAATVLAAAVPVGLFIAFLLVRGALRRRYSPEDADDGPAFSMSQIENMYKKGHISKEEFEILRQNLMEGADLEAKEELN